MRPLAVECFPVGQEAHIVEWFEAPFVSKKMGLLHATTLVLRAADSGHGMLPAFEVSHREFHSPMDDLWKRVEAPLAVGMLTRWSEHTRRHKPSYYFAYRLPL